MNLALFIEHIKKTKTLPFGKVFCFSAPLYPLLFFNYLMVFFKNKDLQLEKLNCADLGGIKATLSTMSFSGPILYWLDDFQALSDKKQEEVVQYLQIYQGPYTVLFFSDKGNKFTAASKKNETAFAVIELPQNIMARDFSLVRSLVSDMLQDKSNFASQLTMYSDYLSLDNICLLAQYELVLGKNSEDFFTQWITRILDPSHSLFILSQYFFSQKPKQFFRQWSLLFEHYPATFWPTFWADQVWRAYIYIDLMKQKEYAQAKKAQYKLPFSLINRDWSRYELAELCNAHQFLTTLDFRLKNGGSDMGIEHFYNLFFENRFQ